MAVNRRVIPPTAGCADPNPMFAEMAKGVYPVLSGEVRSADSTVRAGVSGMGFGGINCHVSIESGAEPAERLRPSIGERELLASNQDSELFVLAAGSQLDMLGSIKRLRQLAQGISAGEMAEATAKSLVEAARRKLLLWGITEQQVDEIIRRGTPETHLTIYSPISGIVTEKKVLEGQYVMEGQDLYTVADDDTASMPSRLHASWHAVTSSTSPDCTPAK